MVISICYDSVFPSMEKASLPTAGEGLIIAEDIGVGGASLLVIALLACRTPAGRSAGQVVDDETITTEVKVKLLE
jgi:hypothetical protein